MVQAALAYHYLDLALASYVLALRLWDHNSLCPFGILAPFWRLHTAAETVLADYWALTTLRFHLFHWDSDHFFYWAHSCHLCHLCIGPICFTAPLGPLAHLCH